MLVSELRFLGWEDAKTRNRTPEWLKALLLGASQEYLREFLRWCTGLAALPPRQDDGPNEPLDKRRQESASERVVTVSLFALF
jgi:hypothetical protein